LSRWIGKKIAKRFAPTMMAMYKTMGALCKAFYEKYGDEAIPIITEVMGKAGVEHAKIAQEMVRGKDMKAVGELFKMMLEMFEMGEITELSDDVLRFKSPLCPMGIEGTTKELCEAMMTNDKMMVSTLLGEEVDTKITQSVAAGDKYCEVIFSKK